MFPLIPILFVLWLVFGFLSCCGVVVALIRRGRRRVALSLLCPAGALLCLAFFSAAIGLAERTWTLSHLEFWLAISIGLAGLLLSAVGWMAVFKASKSARRMHNVRLPHHRPRCVPGVREWGR